MLPITSLHIAGNVFCFISSTAIAYQTIRHPNKLRLFILGYSLVTLPASIINTLQVEGIVSMQCNTLVYFVSTLLMTVTHFFMMLDVAYRLRAGEGNWKHPFVLAGIFFLGGTVVCLGIEICIVTLDITGAQRYPLKAPFIGSIICAIVSDSAVFTYTFMPLIYWRKNRRSEGHSRTTALGIWFFLIQNVWYITYGAVSVCFFIMGSWGYFQGLLALDYVFRFIQNLLFTWPPPKAAINYLSSKLLPSNSIHLSTRKGAVDGDIESTLSNNHTNHVMSSEQYNKEEQVEYGRIGELPASDQRSAMSYGSRVTIVTRS